MRTNLTSEEYVLNVQREQTMPFSIVIPPNASAFDAGRFYSDLTEKVYTGAINLDYKLNPQVETEKQAKISLGAYVAQTDRDFDARWFSYKWSTLSKSAP